MLKTRVEIPAAFQELFEPHRYKIFHGGRGKGASWSFARALLLLVAQRGIRVLCVREYQTSIKASVWQLLSDQIALMGLSSVYRVTNEYIACNNGGLFIFKGVRNNPADIKSTEGVDIAWLTEAERTTQDSCDILFPTIRKEGSEIWIDLNPDNDKAPVYRMIENPPDGAIVRQVTYRDNPFFPEVLRKEMEYCRRTDTDKYVWVWEGEPRKISKSLIFAGKYRVEEFEHAMDDVDRLYFGADWGFADDPTTGIRSYTIDRTLYVDYEVYGIGVEMDELPGLFSGLPGLKHWPCAADNARPETISYMRHHGFPKFRAVKKGAGSVEDGIEIVKGFEEIVVHPRCRHLIAEFGLYSYKVDKLTGDILPIIVDKDNHCIDALRYSHYHRGRVLDGE